METLHSIINVNTFDRILVTIKDTDISSKYESHIDYLIPKRIEIIKKMYDYRKKANSYSNLIDALQNTPFWLEYGNQIKSIPIIWAIGDFEYIYDDPQWKDEAGIANMFDAYAHTDWKIWQVEVNPDTADTITDYYFITLVVANIKPTLEQLKKVQKRFKSSTDINVVRVARCEFVSAEYDENDRVEKHEWEDDNEDN